MLVSIISTKKRKKRKGKPIPQSMEASKWIQNIKDIWHKNPYLFEQLMALYL
jgi:hypothetical protein